MIVIDSFAITIVALLKISGTTAIIVALHKIPLKYYDYNRFP